MENIPYYEGAKKDQPCYECKYNRMCPQAIMRVFICWDYRGTSEKYADKRDKEMKKSKEEYWFEKWDLKDYDAQDAETRKLLEDFNKLLDKEDKTWK